MKRKHSKSFDWYGINQRFSIRKYHFGAASVLLGVALAMGTPVLAHADDQMSAEPAVEVSSSVPVTPVSETLQTTDSTAVSGSDTQSNTAQQEEVPTPVETGQPKSAEPAAEVTTSTTSTASSTPDVYRTQSNTNQGQGLTRDYSRSPIEETGKLVGTTVDSTPAIQNRMEQV